MVSTHFLLERRVPDRATRLTQATLRALAPCGPLPSDVMEHCAAQMTETFEWLPCCFDEWLTMGDVVFARSATTFYEARAASILSHEPTRQTSLWPLLVEWRVVAESRWPGSADSIGAIEGSGKTKDGTVCSHICSSHTDRAVTEE